MAATSASETVTKKAKTVMTTVALEQVIWQRDILRAVSKIIEVSGGIGPLMSYNELEKGKAAAQKIVDLFNKSPEIMGCSDIRQSPASPEPGL